jgi:hypothetical protein
MILNVEDFEKISVRRLKNSNDNHHLFLNNGSTYWMHLTVHCGNAGRQKFRKRIPLGTKDITEARKRRDDLLQGEWLQNAAGSPKSCLQSFTRG